MSRTSLWWPDMSLPKKRAGWAVYTSRVVLALMAIGALGNIWNSVKIIMNPTGFTDREVFTEYVHIPVIIAFYLAIRGLHRLIAGE